MEEQLQNQSAIRLQLLLKGEQAARGNWFKALNDIAKLDKSHLQALEIQKNNTALTREMKAIDQQIAIDQTIAMDSNSIRGEAAIAQQAAVSLTAQLWSSRKSIWRDKVFRTPQNIAPRSKLLRWKIKRLNALRCFRPQTTSASDSRAGKTCSGRAQSCSHGSCGRS